MIKEIVSIKNGEPRVSTWDIKDGFGFGNDHRYVVRMIDKYKNEFEEFGVVASERQKPTDKKGGRPVEAYLLNEDQCLFLGTLFRNNPEVISFKKILVKQFSKQKKILSILASQKQNAQWLETRNAGKVKRREETDTIKRFVEYAVTQGSKNAERYYSNISTMQNKSLFFYEQKFKNLRDILNLQQLSVVICADGIVSKAIEDGMDQKLHYKEIYQLAKKRIESFAEIHGKTLIPAFEQKQISADKMVD